MSKIILYSFVFAINYVNSANIFCATPTHSKSHVIVAHALLKGLAERGHNITIVTPFPIDNPLPNYRQITIELKNENWNSALVSDSANILGFFKNMPNFADMMEKNTEALMAMPEVQKILKDEQFDLVVGQIALSDVVFGFGAHFNCPQIAFLTFESVYTIDSITANPYALSYISHYLPSFPEPMTFKHRLLNLIWYFIDKYYFTDYMNYRNEQLYNKLFPPSKYRSYHESLNNISLFLTAGHFSQGRVRPLLPSIVEIGGIQIKDKPSPLPNELQKWMDESIEGVIYFSMGTNIHSSNLSPKLIGEILAAFQKTKLKVLWKFDNETLASDNIRIEKWVPQNDVLQHRNLKLFIGHGGWGSVMEAKYYGIPMILLPIFGDQIKNSKNIVKQGWGVKLSLFELNEQILLTTINRVLSDPKYKIQAQYESFLYRDRPNTALETGIFWVEYVLRHHGAKHLQSNAVDMNFFQYHSLDVIAFFICISLVITVLIYKCLKIVLTVMKKYLPVDIKDNFTNDISTSKKSI